jgi:hypothetical protein
MGLLKYRDEYGGERVDDVVHHDGPVHKGRRPDRDPRERVLRGR